MNVTNTSMDNPYPFPYEEVYGPRRDSLYIVIPITITYIIIFCSGLIGNVSTCIVIAKNKSMHTATNYYLFSLACSDLLLLISGLPPEIYSMWSRYPYIFGYAFCVLRGLFAETSANATVLTITAFTAERYVAICHPFLSHTMSKLSRVVKLIVLIWIVAVVCAVPQALQFGTTSMEDGTDNVICHVVNKFEYSFEISTFLFFVLPMTIITVLYGMIGLQLRASTLMKRDPVVTTDNFNRAGNISSGKHQQGQSSKRVVKMLVAVVVAFFICWAPFHAQRLVAIYVDFTNMSQRETYLKIYEVVTYISGILYFVSTTINPLLYNIMSNKFREAFKETITRRCCSWPGLKSGKPQGFYTVLSRSTQRVPDSSDSYKDDPSVHTNSTLIHKFSVDSIIFVPPGRSCCDKKSLDKLSTGNRRPIVQSRCEICVAKDTKSNLDLITPNTKLVSVQVSRPPPGKMQKFLRLLTCIDKSSDSITSYYSSPVKDNDADQHPSRKRAQSHGQCKKNVSIERDYAQVIKCRKTSA